MLRSVVALAVAASCLTTACADDPAAGGLVSGLAVGRGPTPFHPLNVTGPHAGEKNCLV